MKKLNLAGVIFGSPMTIQEKMQMARQLSSLLRSGIPIGEALEVLDSQSSKQSFNHVIKRIRKEVSSGKYLFQAMRLFPNIFDPFFIDIIRIGEESGTLEKNLDYLVVHLKKTADFNRKIKNALLYPKIVLVISFIITAGLSIFILPKLIDLFQSLDIELPVSTKILLAIAGVMKDYGFFIFFGIFLAYVGLKALMKINFFKKIWDRVVISLPLTKKFIISVEMAFFTRNIGVMLDSGLPIGAALAVQEEVTPNTVFKKYVAKIRQIVEKGNTIESSLLLPGFELFPIMAVKMIGVGEKTGKLSESLIYLGQFFDEEVDNTTKNFSTYIDPLILIAVGIIVAFIAIAIITPIYQFSSGINR